MNKKTIIILVFLGIIVAYLILSKKTTNTTDDSSGTTGNNNNHPVDQSQGGGQYVDSTERKQNVIYITDEDLAYVVSKAHAYFDWTFSDQECRDLCALIGNYIYTKAEWDKFMQQDSYVTDRVNSWIINDAKKWRYDLLVKTLKDNGITNVPKRTRL